MGMEINARDHGFELFMGKLTESFVNRLYETYGVRYYFFKTEVIAYDKDFS